MGPHIVRLQILLLVVVAPALYPMTSAPGSVPPRCAPNGSIDGAERPRLAFAASPSVLKCPHMPIRSPAQTVTGHDGRRPCDHTCYTIPAKPYLLYHSYTIAMVEQGTVAV